MDASFDRQALSVVEAVYGIVDDTEAWLDGVLAATRPLLDQGHGMIAHTFALDRMGAVSLTSASRASDVSPEVLREAVGAVVSTPPTIARSILAAGPPVVTMRAVWPSLPHEAFPDFRPFESMATFGFVDSTTVRAYDPGGTGLLLVALLAKHRSVDASEVDRWAHLRAHLLAGLRLRTALFDEAILEPSGRVVHAEGVARCARAREALRRQALRIDRAKSARGRSDPAGALRAWQALVSGRWTLIDRFESDGRRYLVARRNDPNVAAPRRLSRRERQVLAYAALGYSNKHIAYTLGLAPSTISSHLRSAMRRVGATNRAALADLWFPAAVANATDTEGSSGQSLTQARS